MIKILLFSLYCHASIINLKKICAVVGIVTCICDISAYDSTARQPVLVVLAVRVGVNCMKLAFTECWCQLEGEDGNDFYHY